jgi:hypothetical protein
MMNTELKALINDAEDHYLQAPALSQFNRQLSSLTERLEAYELLRDCEAEVFQDIADDLQSAFPRLDSQLLMRALEDGLSVLRYGAMAMLQGDPKYLQRQLLEWLPSRVQAYELELVEDRMLRLLQVHLSKRIASYQIGLIQPYLDQVHHALIGKNQPSTVFQQQPVHIG